MYTLTDAPHQGILFHGPPSTNKEIFALAIATWTKSVYFSVNEVTLMNLASQNQSPMTTLFKIAEIKAPSVIFLDNLDQIMPRDPSKESKITLQLKAELMALFNAYLSRKGTKCKVLVIGAVKKPDDLNLAAFGKLKEKIYISNAKSNEGGFGGSVDPDQLGLIAEHA